MAVQIGSKAHSFNDPTGLLSDCHRRVEMFMGALQAVARLSDAPLTDEVRRSLDLSLRYFREAAPKHTADEEESLFPRLRQIDSAELQQALAQMDSLEKDHRWAEPLHDLVDEIGRRYLESGSLTPAETAKFRDAVERLAEMYRRHLQLEDKELFPLADRLLGKEQKDSIAAEMATRRNLRHVVTIG